MDFLESVSVKWKNYKSIGEKPVGFESIKPFNVLIGKNNAGKSALLDVFEYSCFGHERKNSSTPKNVRAQLLKQYKEAELIFSVKFNQSVYDEVYPNGVAKDLSYSAFNKFEGQKIGYRVDGEMNVISNPLQGDSHMVSASIAKHADRILTCKKVFRLGADRDIRKESGTLNKQVLMRNGDHATSIIRQLTAVDVSEEQYHLVKVHLLNALNEIVAPEMHFVDIETPAEGPSTDRYELQLILEGRKRIKLSEMGSGLKTVILVLMNLLVMPKISHNPLDLDYHIFLFEELENNLHPSLQRKLVRYIYDFATKNKCIVFLTTHSSCFIDMLASKEDVQFLHVEKRGENTTAVVKKTVFEHTSIIDDLGVRASDLLQSNCIVWLEGPSDRIYFNRWIELVSGGELIEGIHYQCLFTAGTLLAHYSADRDALISDKEINMLKVNKNSIVMMDGDQNSEGDAYKQRVQSILENIDSQSYAWVTSGKEVENYIPDRLLKKICGKVFGRFERIDRPGSMSKVDFAAIVCSQITQADLELDEGLFAQLKAVEKKIRSYNGL